MREIKFRGKRVDDGDWLYGSYISQNLVEGERSIRYWGGRNNCDLFEVPIDPSTVGQYTGLKDRNGRDIYEGDVVRLDDGDTSTFSEVFFDGGALCVRSSGFTYEYDVIAIGWANENLGVEVEVIGNIHDNPELLEEVITKAREGKPHA